MATTEEIRGRARRLAAEAIEDGVNMWELERYFADPEDQNALATELLAIAKRLRVQGGDA